MTKFFQNEKFRLEDLHKVAYIIKLDLKKRAFNISPNVHQNDIIELKSAHNFEEQVQSFQRELQKHNTLVLQFPNYNQKAKSLKDLKLEQVIFDCRSNSSGLFQKSIKQKRSDSSQASIQSYKTENRKQKTIKRQNNRSYLKKVKEEYIYKTIQQTDQQIKLNKKQEVKIVYLKSKSEEELLNTDQLPKTESQESNIKYEICYNKVVEDIVLQMKNNIRSQNLQKYIEDFEFLLENKVKRKGEDKISCNNSPIKKYKRSP